jgi:hypothetical protein
VILSVSFFLSSRFSNQTPVRISPHPHPWKENEARKQGRKEEGKITEYMNGRKRETYNKLKRVAGN